MALWTSIQFFRGNQASGAVSVATEQERDVAIPVEMAFGVLPRAAPVPPGNPTTPQKVALGRLLFFDPILSSSRDVSCATCHDPRTAWADGRETPIGVGGKGTGPDRMLVNGAGLPGVVRNTPTLLNAGFLGMVTGVKDAASTAPMFWDGRVNGLEAQVPIPIGTRGEMCGADCAGGDAALAGAMDRVLGVDEYRRRFREAFGLTSEAPVTAAHLARAIASFERTLTSSRTAFDRYLEGETKAMNEVQQRGLRIFREAGCQQCHGGPMLSDFKRHVVGFPAEGSDGLREVRTPSLRNLRQTAPYMHNGRLRTLREVLVFYDSLSERVSETLDGGVAESGPPLDPLLRALELREEDFPAIEAFLGALSSEDYDRDVPASVPSGLPVLSPK